jgi:hypothetical protein
MNKCGARMCRIYACSYPTPSCYKLDEGVALTRVVEKHKHVSTGQGRSQRALNLARHCVPPQSRQTSVYLGVPRCTSVYPSSTRVHVCVPQHVDQGWLTSVYLCLSPATSPWLPSAKGVATLGLPPATFVYLYVPSYIHLTNHVYMVFT